MGIVLETARYIAPQATKTFLRTVSRGVSNARRLASGEMTVKEASARAWQTAFAMSRGDLTLRQATLRYIDTTFKNRGLSPRTFNYLVHNFHLQSQKHQLFECILFGGYENWLEANKDLRAIAARTEIGIPNWHVELLRDLFSDIITKDDWELADRLITIGQGDAIFKDWESGIKEQEEKQGLFAQLRQFDAFSPVEEYDKRVRSLIEIAEGRIAPPKIESLLPPSLFEVGKEPSLAAKNAALAALEKLNEITFAAVVGGTAERMNYCDSEGNPLPQATYPFLPLSGKNIFWLHAAEILALANLYHLTQKNHAQPLCAPYFMVTSKVTDVKIGENFENNSYFGLGKGNVAREMQALVPVVSHEGKWLRTGRYTLNMKPGGHGDFWTLYFNSAAQAELALDMKKFTLVVQGNNPFVFAHALEYAGLGMLHDAHFGFATCPREPSAPEGSIVVAKTDGGFSTRNIEYPVMEAFGLEDGPVAETGFSAYPGNLNFIFAANERIRREIADNPFPGQIINLGKPQAAFGSREGKVKGGRAESQLQGVGEVVLGDTADSVPTIVMNAPRGSDPEGHFEVFKNQAGKARDTVATCRQFYSDRSARRLMLAGVKVEHTLTTDSGGKEVPTTQSVIELTPAFANRSDILKGKISGGRIAQRSTLFLSGFYGRVEEMDLEGDLEITVQNEVGDMVRAIENASEVIPDHRRAGKYRIRGLKIRNAGRQKALDALGLWQGDFKEGQEHCRIVIEGNGELAVLPGTIIEGNFDLTVHDGEKVTLSRGKSGAVSIARTKIDGSSWKYEVNTNLSLDTPDLFELRIREKE